MVFRSYRREYSVGKFTGSEVGGEIFREEARLVSYKMDIDGRQKKEACRTGTGVVKCRVGASPNNPGILVGAVATGTL